MNRLELLSEMAARAIDTEWHSSWHWDRDRYGYLTLKGMRQALADAKRMSHYYHARGDAVELVISRLSVEIDSALKIAEDGSEIAVAVKP